MSPNMFTMSPVYTTPPAEGNHFHSQWRRPRRHGQLLCKVQGMDLQQVMEIFLPGPGSAAFREDQVLIDLVRTCNINAEIRGKYEGICW